jgi:hypothetical protein
MAAATVFVALLAGACSSGDDGEANRDAGTLADAGDGGSDAGDAALDSSAEDGGADASDAACVGTLAEVKGNCPDSWTDAMDMCAWTTPNDRMFYTLRTGTCGGMNVTSMDALNHGMNCYYDATSGALAGAYAWEDTGEFCGKVSFDISAGEVPASCPVDGLTQTSCPVPDAGADSG